jgi:hypothetical protein
VKHHAKTRSLRTTHKQRAKRKAKTIKYRYLFRFKRKKDKEPLGGSIFSAKYFSKRGKKYKKYCGSRYNSMSGEFKAIEAKKFITKRMSQRRDVESKIDIKKAVNDIIDYDEDFIAYKDLHLQDYSNDEEIDYILDNTVYKYEFVELVLWQKYIYEMNEGLWEYNVEPCINCASSGLRFREIDGIDFADKIICEECGCEMVNCGNGLELFGADRNWKEYLSEELSFPFEAKVCEYQEGEYISQGDKLRVHNIEDEDDLYGIIVSVRKGRKKYSISLVDLEPIDLNLQGKIAVEEYKGWFCES